MDYLYSLPFCVLQPPNIKLRKPAWLTTPSPMVVFSIIMVTYYLVTGGITFYLFMKLFLRPYLQKMIWQVFVVILSQGFQWEIFLSNFRLFIQINFKHNYVFFIYFRYRVWCDNWATQHRVYDRSVRTFQAGEFGSKVGPKFRTKFRVFIQCSEKARS